MGQFRIIRIAMLGLGAVLGAVPGSQTAAVAASFEQIVENCRNTVGRNIVQACMQAKGKGGDREGNMAACRNTASPQVRACVQRESQKAAAGVAPPPTP